jgi:Ca2+-binding EF-hand superfamily protein
MKAYHLPLFISLTAVTISACPAQEAPPSPVSGDHPRGGHRGNADRLFISPMGEPFRGDSGRAALITSWFSGADTNHDGKLSLTEFRADADRFFATLDTNHDGEIDPDELTHYENEIAPEIHSGSYMGGGGHHGGGSGGGGGGGHHGGGGGHHHGGRNSGEAGGGEGSVDAAYGGGQGAARFGMLDLPEPVASADSDFNRGVSRAEFLHAATERFQALDLDHHGQLTLGELPQHPPKVEHHGTGAPPDTGV